MLNTSHKIFIARTLSAFIMTLRRLFALSAIITKKRGGITWCLDLKEGIDLAIYLLGGFELRTLNKYQKLVQEGDVILDIGANIGAHTLPLAKLVGNTGKVIAFEPTQYAFEKLTQNISLNPKLADRILTCQTMLVNSFSDKLPAAIYSSWPLENSKDLHNDHRGRLMSTQGATITTLDHYVETSGLQSLNLIKLDVDGNEYEVLFGGKHTLSRFKPLLIMELAPCVYKNCPQKFDDALNFLWSLGYEVTNIANGKKLPEEVLKIRQLIPSGGGINVIALSKN